MKVETSSLHQQSPWLALPSRQQQRLFTLLGQWALRVWEEQRLASLPTTSQKGGQDESAERQDPA